MIWILLSICVIFILLKITERHKNFPPGPRGLPLLGYSPFMHKPDQHLHEIMCDLRHRYGPVVGVYLGSVPTVLINGYEAAKECLTNDTCLGRPAMRKVNTFDERLGILFTDGEFWREQRRFMLWHLRDFGFGRGQMEEAIHAEVSDLLDDLEGRRNGLIEVDDLFGVSVVNVLWAMMAGEKFPYGDEGVKRLRRVVKEIFRSGSPTGGFWAAFPVLKKLFGHMTGYEKERRRQLALQEFIQNKIDHHKDTYDDNDMRDFMDTFLREMRSKDGFSTFNENQLIALCVDMFMAGTETSTNFLGFSLLYMVLHPTVQSKVQEELDQVVGRSRLPSLKDRVNLPYTEATLMELLRLAMVVPIAVPHCTTDETQLLGYTLPEKTFLMVNLHSVHMDQKHWKDPEKFRPERFFKDGKVQKDDWLMPFGIGKRVCVGETFARGTTFLFFTGVLQKFTLDVPPGENPPDVRSLGGIGLAPKPFRLKAELRI